MDYECQSNLLGRFPQVTLSSKFHINVASLCSATKGVPTTIFSIMSSMAAYFFQR